MSGERDSTAERAQTSACRNRGPLAMAIFLLLLPLLYLLGYLVLVDPIKNKWALMHAQLEGRRVRTEDYRLGGNVAAFCFWPLEQIDRRLFPSRWEQRQVLEIWTGPMLNDSNSPPPVASGPPKLQPMMDTLQRKQ